MCSPAEDPPSDAVTARARLGDATALAELRNRAANRDDAALDALFTLARERVPGALDAFVTLALRDGHAPARDRLLTELRAWLRQRAETYLRGHEADPSDTAQSTIRRLLAHLPEVRELTGKALLRYLDQVLQHWVTDRQCCS